MNSVSLTGFYFHRPVDWYVQNTVLDRYYYFLKYIFACMCTNFAQIFYKIDIQLDENQSLTKM